MAAQYFVEAYPEEDQLIYVFLGKDDRPVRPEWAGIFRYCGQGLLVNAGLFIEPIYAGMAWEACNKKIKRATLEQ